MKVLIIRHAESQKNKLETFATSQDLEPLTANGIRQSRQLGKDIYSYVQDKNLICKKIYAANSLRALSTARYIASEIKAEVISVSEFVSLKNNIELRGLSEAEVKRIDDTFMHELLLSRVGIFNAYNYSSNWNEAIIKEHEMMVWNKYNNIISANNDDLIIIVMHHSSLTAVLINIARKYYGYPIDFFGNIEAELCNLFLINHHDNMISVDLANVPGYMLNQD